MPRSSSLNPNFVKPQIVLLKLKREGNLEAIVSMFADDCKIGSVASPTESLNKIVGG